MLKQKNNLARLGPEDNMHILKHFLHQFSILIIAQELLGVAIS